MTSSINNSGYRSFRGGGGGPAVGGGMAVPLGDDDATGATAGPEGGAEREEEKGWEARDRWVAQKKKTRRGSMSLIMHGSSAGPHALGRSFQ
jgi:hypothetical protein